MIESSLTADPPLQQVVSHTWELGLRGKLASWGTDQKLEWTAGLFHTTNTNDIIAVSSPVNGRGFFQNAGETLRKGVEGGIVYQDSKWFTYTNYAYVDATFETANILSSPDNHTSGAFDCEDGPGSPFEADDPICIQVNPGDSLPGVPNHRFKAGVDYWVTDAWKVGADVSPPATRCSSATRVTTAFHSTVTRRSISVRHIISRRTSQIYGMVDNVFDNTYGLFGNFFNRRRPTTPASRRSGGRILRR